MIPTPKYLDRPAQAEWLLAQGVRMTAQRLADMAYDGEGPHYVIINGRALSTVEWLLAWIEEQAARPVPAAKQAARRAVKAPKRKPRRAATESRAP